MSKVELHYTDGTINTFDFDGAKTIAIHGLTPKPAVPAPAAPQIDDKDVRNIECSACGGGGQEGDEDGWTGEACPKCGGCGSFVPSSALAAERAAHFKTVGNLTAADFLIASLRARLADAERLLWEISQTSLAPLPGTWGCGWLHIATGSQILWGWPARSSPRSPRRRPMLTETQIAALPAEKRELARVCVGKQAWRDKHPNVIPAPLFVASAVCGDILEQLANALIERDRLRRFAGNVLRAFTTEYADVGGDVVQDAAEACGLFENKRPTVPCCEDCRCAEYVEPGRVVDCYTYTELARACVAAAESEEAP